MNLKKIVVNSLAVVGAIVVTDKVVNAICNKSTKAVSEELLKKFSHGGHCCCKKDEDSVDTEEESSENNSEDNSFPDIEKYEEPSDDELNEDEPKTYEFTVKAENITSDSKEV